MRGKTFLNTEGSAIATHADDMAIPLHVYRWYTPTQGFEFCGGVYVESHLVRKREEGLFSKQLLAFLRKRYSGPQACCVSEITLIMLLATAYVAGCLTMVQVRSLIPSVNGMSVFAQTCMERLGSSFGDALGERVTESTKKIADETITKLTDLGGSVTDAAHRVATQTVERLTQLGTSMADVIAEKAKFTVEKTVNVFTNLFKIVEVAALAVCFSNISPLCETTAQWASLIGLVLIPKFGQEVLEKFLKLFSGAKAHSSNVEPFVNVFFTLLSVLFTGSMSTTVVNNFFRISDITGLKDVMKLGSKAAVEKIADVAVNFLRFLVSYRSNTAVNEILKRVDIAEAQRNVVKSVPALLLEMEQAILVCGQMSSDYTLFKYLGEYQDLVAHAHGVLRELSIIHGYPFVERVHFSRVYMKLYETVMTLVNSRNVLARVEPTVIYLAGPAGIMKTTAAEDLAYKIATRLYPKELAEGSYKYDRNAKQKHWDRYCYQPICKFEEAFSAPGQGKDTANEEHQAWLSLVSTSVYPLPMAAISDKKTVFTSEVIICTSNIAFPETQSVDRAALLRRFHNHVLFCWNPGFPRTYALDDPNKPAGATTTGAMADYSHCTMYVNDESKSLPVPAGARQVQFGNRNFPTTVGEFATWNLVAEDNGEHFQDLYSSIDLDLLVDRVCDSVQQRRNRANVRAQAHAGDVTTTLVWSHENGTRRVDSHTFVHPSGTGQEELLALTDLEDLLVVSPGLLRKLATRPYASTTRRLFAVWHARGVPLTIPNDLVADEEVLTHFFAIVVAYRQYCYDYLPPPRDPVMAAHERLGNNGFDLNSDDGFVEGPDIYGNLRRVNLRYVRGTQNVFDPSDFADLITVAESRDIWMLPQWTFFVVDMLCVLVPLFIFFIIYVFLMKTICNIITGILKFFLGKRRKPNANALDELDHMLKRAQDQGLERRQCDNGSEYHKGGVKYEYDREKRDWVPFQSPGKGCNKSKGTRYAKHQRIRNARAHADEWMDDLTKEIEQNSPNLRLIDMIASQCVKVTYTSYTGRLMTMYGLQIIGQIVMLPRHILAGEDTTYYNFFVETDTISFRETVNATHIKSFTNAKGVKGYDLEKTDGLLIEFKNLPVKKKLVNHVARDLVSPSLLRKVEAIALVPRFGPEGPEFRCTLAIPVGKISTLGPLSYRDGQYAEYTAQLYKTSVPELAEGDCGSILMVREEGQLRIVGFYVAGDTGNGLNYFQPITRDLIENLTSNVNVAGFASYPETDPTKPLSRRIKNPLPSLGRYVLADAPGVVNIPPSEIRPSDLQLENPKLFGHPVDTAPAVLNREALQLAVNKKYHKPGYFDTPFLERAVEWIKEDLSTHIQPCRKVNLEIGLDGQTQYGKISKIDLATSPGLPWTVTKEQGSVGKTSLFQSQDDVLFPIESLKAAIEQVEKGRCNGEIQPALFRGTLKDERRDLERVKDSKTRIFTAGSVEKVIADRMLFSEFVAQFKAKRILLQHAYGINPEDLEWNEMIQRHLAIGSHHFGFDYSGFDASESLQLLQAVSDCISSCFEEEYRREVVASGVECFNHFVVIDGDVYAYHQGNPSGCVMTTIYNTIANWILLYYAWIKLAAENEKPLTRTYLHQNCVIHAYGDDFIATVSSDALWYNGDTIPPILEVCGVKATAPDKTACARFYPLKELTFLTRSFVPNTFEGPKAIYVGPLPKGLIEDIPMWFYKGAMDDDYLSTIRTCVRSAAFWGKEYFSWYVSKLRTTRVGKQFVDLLDLGDIFREASRPFCAGTQRTVDLDRVFFSSKREPKFLSNFHLCEVTYRGFQFPSVENAYQFAKEMFHDSKTNPTPYFTMHPAQAKKKGGLVKTKPAWDKVKNRIMKELLDSKFSSESLARKLHETGSKVLVEWTPDKYWGCGLPIDSCTATQLNWPGLNNLGLLLMDVRSNLNF